MSTNTVEIQLQNRIDYLASKDRILNHIIGEVDSIEFSNTYNVFEDLLSCILDMRIHYTPTAPAFRYPRLKKALAGAPIDADTILNLHSEIRSTLKLSHQKDESMRIWAEKWKNENLTDIAWQSLSDDQVYQHLSGVKGVGNWSKQMILIFTLERHDIFPASDYQLTKAMMDAYSLESATELDSRIREISDRWRPYRSVAVRYLWRWREMVKRSTSKF